MAILTATDIGVFRAAGRVVLIEANGSQTVVCSSKGSRRRAGPREYASHEVTIHQLLRRDNGRLDARRSAALGDAQMPAWRRLCDQLRPGDRLSLAWDGDGRADRAKAPVVLLNRSGHLRHFRLDAGVAYRRGASVRASRVVLVSVAAVGFWALARHSLLMALFVAAMLLVGLAAHRRRTRDGWPLGTVRLLRLLSLLGVAAVPSILVVLVMFGILYGCVHMYRAARRAVAAVCRPRPSWRLPRRRGADNANGERLQQTAPARGSAAVVDLEPGADGVHRTPTNGNGRAVVAPVRGAGRPEAYAAHVRPAAAVLDAVGPVWELLVDRDGLNEAADPGGFVLESIFGQFDLGLKAVVDYLRAARPSDVGARDCVQAAFGDSCEHLETRSERAHNDALRVAWSDELARRVRHNAPAS